MTIQVMAHLDHGSIINDAALWFVLASVMQICRHGDEGLRSHDLLLEGYFGFVAGLAIKLLDSLSILSSSGTCVYRVKPAIQCLPSGDARPTSCSVKFSK